MDEVLDAIFQRRAVKVFEPVEISDELRCQILDAARHAPSSFNSALQVLLGAVRGKEGRGGEAMPRTEARGNRFRIGRGGCRPPIAVCHLAGSARVDAQEQLRRRRNPRSRAKYKDRSYSIHAWTIRSVCCDQTGLL